MDEALQLWYAGYGNFVMFMFVFEFGKILGEVG